MKDNKVAALMALIGPHTPTLPKSAKKFKTTGAKPNLPRKPIFQRPSTSATGGF